MSEAQVKATPSKAASQGAVTLAMELIKEPHIEKWAALIDLKLSDLLEKAERVCNWIGDDSASCYKANLALEKALEPWKPK